MKARKILGIGLALMLSLGSAQAQSHWAVKTNVLHDATGSVNLALEYAFAPQWSVELSGGLNMWPLGRDLSIRHATLQPELRFWFCERFDGWFVSANLLGGYSPLTGHFWDFSQYNSRFPNLKAFNLRDALMLGVGGSVGYDFILGRHWNLELELGVGYMYTRGDEYEHDVLLLKGSEFDYIGLNRLGLTIVYLF